MVASYERYVHDTPLTINNVKYKNRLKFGMFHRLSRNHTGTPIDGAKPGMSQKHNSPLAQIQQNLCSLSLAYIKLY